MNGKPGLRTCVAAAIVTLVAFGLYARTIGYGLVWDDPQLLQYIDGRYRQGGLRGLALAEYNLQAAEPLGYYRPVVLLSLWADARLAGLFPPIFHLTNVLLHTANALLLLALLRTLGSAAPVALLAALVFAAHPAHTESVAFVAGRTDLWATFFVLIGALCWAAERAGAGSRSVALRAAGLAAAFLAALSKETALLLPAILLLAGRPGGRVPGDGPALQRRGSRFWLFGWLGSLGAALLLRVAIAQVGFGALFGGAVGAPVQPLAARLSQFPAVLATYLRLLVLPWPLNAYYTSAEVRLDAVTVAAALGLAGALVAAVVLARRGGVPAPALPLVWVVGFLLPVLGVVPVRGAVVAERFLYLPSVGVSLALAAALGARTSFPWSRRLSAAALLALGGVGVLAREGVWRDDLTLFQSVVAASPAGADGYHGLGLALAARGRHAQAAEAYRSALELAPDFARAAVNLGVSERALGRSAAAVEAYGRALALEPFNPQAHHNLGSLLAPLGRYDEAAGHFEQALRQDPGFALARYNLGRVRLRIGEPQRALEEYRRLAPLESALAEKLLGEIRRGARDGE